MPAATTTLAFDVPPATVLWPLLLIGGVYFLLRFLIRRGRDISAAASRHALCTGVIGWMASSLLPAANAGILPLPGASSGPVDIAPALAWPVLGSLATYVLGQATYPRALARPLAQGGRPPALRALVSRPLAWTVAVIFLLSTTQIVWTSTLPGFEARPYGSRPDGAGGYATFGGEGRIAGMDLAMYLGGALLVLAGGTLAVLMLTSRRAPVNGLAPGQDRLLRAITINRLLRTVATIASGLAAIAGNHAARPDPAVGPPNWFNPAGALNLAVLLMMLLWAPPSLSGRPASRRGAGAQAQPAARLSVSIGAAMGLAAFVPVPAAIFVPGTLTGNPALFAAVSAGAILAVVSLGEVLVHRNYGTPDEPLHWPRQPVSSALACTLVAAATILLAVLFLVAGPQGELGAQQSWPVTAWSSAAVVVASGVPLVLVRRRNSVPGPVLGLDVALRAITVHRVVRTQAAFLAGQAGVLLMSAGPKLNRASPLGPERWDAFWQAAPAVGALLAAAAVGIAVIPVQGAAPPLPRTPGLPQPPALSPEIRQNDTRQAGG
ncbi:hypothetical protein [Pseudarthrobacter sp. NPDC058119]|uniref:hypothetical protein n=1 Tax=Pseudarthrobacter sp. NPDC058119 TaxID=3346348 RepID=UPI0036D8F0E8